MIIYAIPDACMLLLINSKIIKINHYMLMYCPYLVSVLKV